MAPPFTQSGQCPNQIERIAKLPSMFQMSQRLGTSPVARRNTVFLKRQLCSSLFGILSLAYWPALSHGIDLCDSELIVRSLSNPGLAFSGMRGSKEMVCH
jgi:hypothetical protein